MQSKDGRTLATHKRFYRNRKTSFFFFESKQETHDSSKNANHFSICLILSRIPRCHLTFSEIAKEPCECRAGRLFPDQHLLLYPRQVSPWFSARMTLRVILIEIIVFRLEEKKTAECVDGIHLQYEGLKKCKMVSVFT